MKIILSTIKQKQKTYIEDDLSDDTDSKDIKNVSDGVIKEINFGNNIEIPSDDEVAVDGPKIKNKKRH